MASSDTRSSSNPNFEANMSSDEIYFGQDMETCITDVVNGKADLDHTHSGYAIQSDLESLENIVDTKADSAHSHTEYVTTTAFASFETEVDGKANVNHSHVIADVTGLQSALDSKSASSHNHDSRYYTETEVNSLLSNKSDSTHTHDSFYDALGTAETKANAVQANLNVVSSDLTEHIEDTDIHFTATERIKLSGIATGANNYTHPNSGVTAGTYKNVTVNAQGHITGGTNPTTLAGYGITDADAKGAASSALTSAKAYADELIADEVTNRNSAISTAKSSAISTAASDATTKANNALASARSYTDSKVAALVDSAPETMDTLKEVADAISAHEDVTDVLNAAIGTKANASDLTSHIGNKSNPHSVTKSQVGLGNVPNVATNDQTPTYSDATTLATLASGEKLSVAFGKIKLAITNLLNHIANKNNPHSVTKAQVGLGNVDNTSDANKPISTATQTALDGKASSSHTHSAATTSSAGLMSASDKSKLNGITESADSVSFSRSLTSGTKVGTITINGTGTDLYAPTNTDTHYVSGTVVGSSASATSNTTSALTNGNVYVNHIENGSVKNSHKISGSGATTVTSDASGNIIVSSTNTTYGVATSSGLGLVKSGTDITVDSSGNVSVNDDSHNHVISNIDGLQSALDGKSATSHNHDSAYISKSLQMTADSGDVYVNWSGKDVVAQIKALSTGMYTAYAKSGTTNNPKTTEAWRFMVHKTSATYGWTMAFSSYGGVYSGYVDNDNWKGWRCIYDANPAPLWTGAVYMTSTNGTPQVVTPSKKLSECQHGWLLLWSDYDPGDGANDADFVTTMIPKRNATGGTWGGKSFLCDIPRYVGSDATDTSTEKRIIKPIYVHDDCIKGSYQNASGDRNDVVLRAVYEY